MPTLDDVYRKFGEVSEAAQLLETEMGNILLGVRGFENGLFSKKDPEIAKAILEQVNRSTLGQLVKAVGNAAASPESIEKAFALALKERNRLTHHFYREHNFRRNTDEGRDIMLRDLDQMHEHLITAYKIALGMSGIDLNKFAGIMPTKHLPI